MHRNVGSKERYARLALGAVAGAAAANTSGWPRAALGTVAAAGLATGVARYCPINQVAGRDSYHGSRLEEGRHNAEVRRESAVRAALGVEPSGDEPTVTRQTDLFARAEESLR